MNILWSNADVPADVINAIRQEFPKMSEFAVWNIAQSRIQDDLETLRSVLKVNLEEDILVIGDLGRWNGRSLAYREIQSGNLSDCFVQMDEYSTFYIEDGELRGSGEHHDGTNFYRFRVWKPKLEFLEKQKVLEAIYNNEDNLEEILDEHTQKLGETVERILKGERDSNEN